MYFFEYLQREELFLVLLGHPNHVLEPARLRYRGLVRGPPSAGGFLLLPLPLTLEFPAKRKMILIMGCREKSLGIYLAFPDAAPGPLREMLAGSAVNIL